MDDIVEAVRPEAVAGHQATALGDAAPFAFPAGVSPDQKDAVLWLAGYEEPYRLVVDGYNVTFLLDESSFTETAARDRLNEGLARFRRAAVCTRAGDCCVRLGPIGGSDVQFWTGGD